MGLPKGADLMRTPVSNPNNHYMTMDIHGSLSENGDLKGKIFIEAEGQTDASIRRMFTSNFQQNWVPTLQKELLKIHPDIEIIDINYGKNPLKHLEGEACHTFISTHQKKKKHMDLEIVVAEKCL